MKQLKGVFLAMISSSTFGMIPLFALPVLRSGMNLESVLFYRFAISTVVIGAYLLLRKNNLRVSVKEFITLFGLGSLYALTALFLTASYLHVPSGIATTVHFLYPVVVTGIMILFYKSKASLPVLISTLMAIGGVYLLSGAQSGENISIKGLMMVLLTVFTYALYIVGINKSCISKMEGLKMTFYVLFASAMVFLANLFFKGEGLDTPSDLTTGINLLLLALIPTLVSDLTLILAIQHVGSTTTAILGCMEPLTAVALGVVFLNEFFGTDQVAGVLIILLAVLMIILDSAGLFSREKLRILFRL
ncbi:MAG: DMT family transporter [Bacteroidales bacterium]